MPRVTTDALRSPPGAIVPGCKLAETSDGGWATGGLVTLVRVGLGAAAAVGDGCGVGVNAGGVGVGVGSSACVGKT